MTTRKSLKRGRYWAAFALALPACGSSHDEPTSAATAAVALTTGEIDGASVTYRQRLSLSSIGSAPVRLANGQLLDVARAADAALVQHRQLASEAAAARSALFADAETTEELIETEHTIMLVAITRLTVADPTALARLSPILGKFHFKGPNSLPLAKLDAQQRALFNEIKGRLLQKPKAHPLAAAARQGDAALWAALLSGKGDRTIVTTVERPISGPSTNGGSYFAPAVVDGSFGLNRLVHRLANHGGTISRRGLGEALPELALGNEGAGSQTAAAVPHAGLASSMPPRVDANPPPSREEFAAAYAACGKSIRGTAKHFGKDRRQIYRWLERFGIPRDDESD